MKYNAFSTSANAYQNLDVYVNNFAKIDNIVTELLYGSNDNKGEVFISLIIPTYNRKQTFKEALESAINQENIHFSWEIIVIDNTPLDSNGMTAALEIIKSLGSKKVKYYHNQENIGSGYNWNRGVELANGKWITLLHDDDVVFSDALFNISKIIAKYESKYKKQLGYIHARSKSFTETESLQNEKLINLPFCLELTRFTALVLGHTHTGKPTCGTTILKEAYIKVGGVNYDFGPTADAVLGYLIMKSYIVLRSGAFLGGYRFIDNETLKISTLEKLLQTDYLFAQYRYGLNKFSMLWGYIFEKSQLRDNIDAKLNIIKQYSCVSADDHHECKMLESSLSGCDANIAIVYLFKLCKLVCVCIMAIKGLWKFKL